MIFCTRSSCQTNLFLIWIFGILTTVLSLGIENDVLVFVHALNDRCPEYGLHLNLGKCEVFWPSASPTSFDLFPRDIIRNWTNGNDEFGS